MAREKIDATTFKEVDTVDGTTYEVVVGDDKQPSKFEQQAKLQVQFPGGEANEVNFSARLVDWVPLESKSLVEESDKLRSVAGNEYESVFYPAVGEYKFDVILHKPPSINVFTWTLTCKNLSAHYQPDLSQEQVEFGDERPDRIVGSYAFYHASKRDHKIGEVNYRTGKAFHIYRPLVTDNKGATTWGVLNISKALDVMTVTVDPAWLAKASYPVVIDPDFGYTTTGGTRGAMYSNYVNFSFATPSSSGTLDSITAYLDRTFGGSSPNVKAAIWVKSSGTHQETSSTVHTISSWTNSANQKDFTCAGTLSLSSSTEYLVGVTPDASETVCYYDNNDPDTGGYETPITYSTPGDLSTPYTNDASGYTYSIYGSYTEASGVTVTVPAKAFSFTKTAPTVGTGAAVTVPAKAFTFTKTAPTVGTGVAVTVPAKAFTFNATAPTVGTGVAVTVPAKAFAFSAVAPSVGTGVAVTVPAKAFSFSAVAPTITANSGGAASITVPAKAFAFNAVAPTVGTGVAVTVPAKAFTFNATAPTVGAGVAVTVPAKAFAFNAVAPTVGTGVAVTVPAKAFAFSAVAPSLLVSRYIAVPAKAFTFTKTAPAVGTGVRVVVGAKAFTFTSTAPTVTTGNISFIPGIEYTAQGERMHYTLAGERLQYTAETP